MTNPTRQTLSARRRSAKGSGMRTFRVRPVPCRRRCGMWKRGKTRLEGAEADVIAVTACVVRGEREDDTTQCVHVFLYAARCPPLGGAIRFELLVCSHLRETQRVGPQAFWPAVSLCFFSFFCAGGLAPWTFAWRVLPVSDGPALVFVCYAKHGRDACAIKNRSRKENPSGGTNKRHTNLDIEGLNWGNKFEPMLSQANAREWNADVPRHPTSPSQFRVFLKKIEITLTSQCCNTTIPTKKPGHKQRMEIRSPPEVASKSRVSLQKRSAMDHFSRST